MENAKKIFLVILACVVYCVQSYAQISFDKNVLCLQNIIMERKCCSDIFEIKVDSNPIVQSNVFTDLNGNPLSGTFHIIINQYQYVIAELSKGIVNGYFTIYKYNQEYSKYLMKQGLYDGEQKYTMDLKSMCMKRTSKILL